MNNNEYNIKLYNSVFNNVYLKKIIFNHLTIYNILYNDIQFKSHQQWEQFKYKEYLNHITLNYDDVNLSKIPENIKHIEIKRMNNLNSIPNHIESIQSSTFFSGQDLKNDISNSNPAILSRIMSCSLDPKSNTDQIDLNELLPSVTDLKINIQNNIELKKEMFPIKLKRIWLRSIKSLENGCSFESLSSAFLHDCSPSIINQIISNNLVKLKFICYGSNISNKFDSSIIFPESLQELTISCYSFNTKLPSNLKSLVLTTNQFADTIIFPSSLEHISVSIVNPSNKEVFNNKELVPCNLKSLEFPCSSIVDNNGQSILPDKLESLKFYSIYFNQVLQVDKLPSSLTYLDLGCSYNQVININVLPSNLKTLVLSSVYTQIINPLAIPQQLELLAILNPAYNHPINLPVSTHPNTLIKCENLKLYYDPSNTSIRKLDLSDYNSSLSTLQLQDKSSLEYLKLGYRFNQPIELSDLPINNNIKTIELGYSFNQTINLEHFQNLETIILPEFSKAKIITNQQNITYNNYNLKNIIVPSPSIYNSQFLINLDKSFYQFLKIEK